MRSEDLYTRLLGVVPPWEVVSVELDMPKKVEVFVRWDAEHELKCPECGKECPRHDTRTRSWRHLDTCQLATVLTAEVPRTSCPEHGVRQVSVPWAAPGSRLTAMFEAVVIDWLRVASTTDVAEQLGLSWSQVDGVMQRAVARGLARRQEVAAEHLGVDETSFQKRHEYVTVVTDLDEERVVHVADGRGKEALGAFLQALSPKARDRIVALVMDMHGPFIAAAKHYLCDAEDKICFDKFHVAALLSKALDQVRRDENRKLRAQGSHVLLHTRYLWLRNPDNMSEDQWTAFGELRESKLRTARAWAIKEAAMALWTFVADEKTLREAWQSVINWGRRCHLEPVKRAAKTIREHLDGILRAQQLGITNARGEGINAMIQLLKRRARGYRNRDRFRAAIYFHLGKLDLYPHTALP
jgi:transposase